MDEIRDTQKTDSISRFIDTHTVRTNPFGENRAGERAYRRAERIVAAIHLLTNHIEATEPVSVAVRTGAVELLEDMLELRSEMRSPRSSAFAAAQARIRHLISLVRVLTVSGYTSMQNATTMVEALDELGSFLTSAQRSNLSESFAISRDDLLDVRASQQRPTKAQIKDVKDNTGSMSDNTKPVGGESLNISNNQGRVSVRGKSILEVLQSGGAMGIREVSSHLPEYSEKMIQRELSALVESKMVSKEGEKRWSKYSIAN